MRLVYLIIFIGAVVSCGGDHKNVEKDKYELLEEAYEINLEKWNGLGLVDYSFNSSFTWYCNESEASSVMNVVEAGQPTRENGYTAEDIFILVAEKIELQSYKLEVEYHEVYGVPLKVDFNDSYSIADDEWCMVISNFEPGAASN